MLNNIKFSILKIIPEEHGWKITLLENWANIIGELKNSITIEQIKEDVLFLGVEHPVWAQELLILTPLLKQKINAYFDRERVKTIQIKLKKTKKREVWHYKQLSYEGGIKTALTVNEICALNIIKTEDLKQAMHDFYLRCKTKQIK